MITPGKLDLPLLRWQPFKFTVDFVGYDFTGATFKAEFRAFRDAPDPALISLSNALSPSQGISVSAATTGGVTTSTVEIRIDEATIEGLPFTNPRWLEGSATVYGGSTQI